MQRTSLLIPVVLLCFAGSAFAQDKVQPPTVTLTVATGKTTATVSWTAPGDACTNATVAEYDVRYSSSPITECNFTSATALPSIPMPSSPGTPGECAGFSSSGTLGCNTLYYFAWKCKDSAGNWSDIATATGTTKGCGTSTELLCP